MLWYTVCSLLCPNLKSTAARCSGWQRLHLAMYSTKINLQHFFPITSRENHLEQGRTNWHGFGALSKHTHARTHTQTHTRTRTHTWDKKFLRNFILSRDGLKEKSTETRQWWKNATRLPGSLLAFFHHCLVSALFTLLKMNFSRNFFP